MMTRCLLGLLAILALAACGTTRTERGLSGAAIGAGLGAAAGEVIGDKPGTGAIVGGAAGAATGVLTAPNDDHRSRYHSREYDENDCYYDRSRRRYYCDND